MILDILNSNGIIALITLVVGFGAFQIYRKQKRDAKRDAANVILLEIESAEQQLQTITQNEQSGSLAENTYLMKNSSWDGYRYLFVRDFDRNEWDKISDFYSKCHQYDDAVAFNNKYFGGNVEKTQLQLQRILAEYAKDFTEDTLSATTDVEKLKLKDEYEQRKNLFIDAYGLRVSEINFPPPYFYNPQKPVNEAKAILSTIETSLSLTSVGIKLKRMATKVGLWKRLALTMLNK